MFLLRLEQLFRIGKNEIWREIIEKFVKDYTRILDMPDGSYELCHGAFYNVMSTEVKQDNDFEYHKKYIDIHCTISGVERIEGAFFTHFLGNGNYSEEKDAGFFPSIDEKDCTFYVEVGNCAIFMPYEVHKTLLIDDRPNEKCMRLKKAIIKIPHELWEKAC